MRGTACGRLYLLGKIRPFRAERRLGWAPFWMVLWSRVEEEGRMYVDVGEL
jgi:hypothetical protein